MTDSLLPAASDVAVRPEDSDNPRHVLNLVPDAVRRSMERIPAEYLLMDEVELESHAPRQKWTLVDRRLRTAFWIEYARAQDAGTGMQMTLVYSGTCSRPYFYNTILESKSKLAYIMSPPTNYALAMEEALNFGVMRLREILDFPLYTTDKDGIERPDAKVADVILKTVALIDQRVKGAVIQRIEQKNLNVHMGAKTAKDQDVISVDEIDRKLAELSNSITPAHRAITVDGVLITEESNDEPDFNPGR